MGGHGESIDWLPVPTVVMLCARSRDSNAMEDVWRWPTDDAMMPGEIGHQPLNDRRVFEFANRPGGVDEN